MDDLEAWVVEVAGVVVHSLGDLRQTLCQVQLAGMCHRSGYNDLALISQDAHIDLL
ncbi:MAG: hypothetical protein ABIY56_02615 [Dokdonella sp.]